MLTRSANLHYQGQTIELTVPVETVRSIAARSQRSRRRSAEHERTYGHRAGPDEPVELVTILVTGTAGSKTRVPERIFIAGGTERSGRRVLRPETGWLGNAGRIRSALRRPRVPGH